MRVRREKELKPASVREEDKDSSERVDESGSTFTRAGCGVSVGGGWGRYSGQIGGPQDEGVRYSRH